MTAVRCVRDAVKLSPSHPVVVIGVVSCDTDGHGMGITASVNVASPVLSGFEYHSYI